jgi:hypothetical protein
VNAEKYVPPLQKPFLLIYRYETCGLGKGIINMEEILKQLNLSSKHLDIVNLTLQTYPPYAQTSAKLRNVALFDQLLREIYAGGKKGGKDGYGRQMILGDLLEYVLTGRGYYFAVRGTEQMESFVRVLMHASNLLILMEDISVDVSLRNQVLDDLANGIESPFFENADEKEAFQNLRHYGGKIVGNEGEDYDTSFDSIFPKRVGEVPELLVYSNLIRKRYGYVVPLLQAQRLLGKCTYIIPPDFLLLRSKSEIFGLEVGYGKERQISAFSTVTSIPVFNVGIGSPDQPQPYRCGKCQKWITYCDKVIDSCAKNTDGNEEELDCTTCPQNQSDNCSSIVYHGEARDYTGNLKTLRYHYQCVKSDPRVVEALHRARTPKLIAPFPHLCGLENISEEI